MTCAATSAMLFTSKFEHRGALTKDVVLASVTVACGDGYTGFLVPGGPRRAAVGA
jgi:hypothetical protein